MWGGSPDPRRAPWLGCRTEGSDAGEGGGEKLSRYVVQEGEVILGDRAYGTARGLHAVSQQGAKVVVRFNPASLRTCDLKRRRIHLEEREEKVPSVGAV